MKLSKLLLFDIFLEMTKWGAFGGALLGALYGTVITYLAASSTSSTRPESLISTLVGYIVLVMPFGAFGGAVFGGTIGIVLGFLNGVVLSLITWALFFPPKDPHMYQRSVGIISTTFTFAVGIRILSYFDRPYPFFAFVLLPALIAAVVSGYASQRAARWYLAAVTASQAADTTI